MKSYKKLKIELLNDKETKKFYDELGSEFALIEKLIDRRTKQGLTQSALARKIGTKQSAISRLESGSYNPSLAFLKKVANALDSELTVSIR